MISEAISDKSFIRVNAPHLINLKKTSSIFNMQMADIFRPTCVDLASRNTVDILEVPGTSLKNSLTSCSPLKLWTNSLLAQNTNRAQSDRVVIYSAICCMRRQRQPEPHLAIKQQCASTFPYGAPLYPKQHCSLYRLLQDSPSFSDKISLAQRRNDIDRGGNRST